jgi:hypothetical protein
MYEYRILKCAHINGKLSVAARAHETRTWVTPYLAPAGNCCSWVSGDYGEWGLGEPITLPLGPAETQTL